MHARSSFDTALATTDLWDVGFVSCAVHDRRGRLAAVGDDQRTVRIASITKALVSYAVCVAVEEGTLSFDAPIGHVDAHPVHPELTVRHLLAHAGGYTFEAPEPVTTPGRRRMYSNTGFELLGSVLAERAGMSVESYVGDAVFSALNMSGSALRGSPAKDVWSSVSDLEHFLHELLAPTLISAETFADFTSVQMAQLSGVVPGLGSYKPCPWGLGVEIRGTKSPHWTGRTNSPETFGHFGGSGTFLWVDPNAARGPLAMVCLTDREFGSWSLQAWPALSDAVLGVVW